MVYNDEYPYTLRWLLTWDGRAAALLGISTEASACVALTFVLRLGSLHVIRRYDAAIM